MMQKTIQKTEQEAYQRLSALCVTAEYCVSDMYRKMLRWEMEPGAKERVVERLIRERFVDEVRFASAFVRDKSRYNHWGRVRIQLELRKKGIAPPVIEEALGEIEEEGNLDILRNLIERKRPSVKGRNDYEVRMKLIRFALSRGFTMNEIGRVIDAGDVEDISQ